MALVLDEMASRRMWSQQLVNYRTGQVAVLGTDWGVTAQWIMGNYGPQVHAASIKSIRSLIYNNSVRAQPTSVFRCALTRTWHIILLQRWDCPTKRPRAPDTQGLRGAMWRSGPQTWQPFRTRAHAWAR